MCKNTHFFAINQPNYGRCSNIVTNLGRHVPKLERLLMDLLSTGLNVRRLVLDRRAKGNTIGLVPTMGALHQGHLELIKTAKAENDWVVCSIFVNPTQFNNPEDLARYPRTLEADRKLLESVGCDAVFAPSVEEMYPAAPDLKMDFGLLETVMEGAFRPGHFNGVGIVVAKLFNIVQPDQAYFGQKDLQQTAVIRSLVRNLSFPIALRICPTVRESDGLAMSSRNVRLSPEERALAPEIYKTLSACKAALLGGAPAKEVLSRHSENLDRSGFNTEYLELVDVVTLQAIDGLKNEGGNALCIATHLGPVRLIDNLVF